MTERGRGILTILIKNMTSCYRVFDINNEAFNKNLVQYRIINEKILKKKNLFKKKHLGAQNVNPLLLCVLSNVKVMVEK